MSFIQFSTSNLQTSKSQAVYLKLNIYNSICRCFVPILAITTVTNDLQSLENLNVTGLINTGKGLVFTRPQGFYGHLGKYAQFEAQ